MGGAGPAACDFGRGGGRAFNCDEITCGRATGGLLLGARSGLCERNALDFVHLCVQRQDCSCSLGSAAAGSRYRSLPCGGWLILHDLGRKSVCFSCEQWQD